MSMIQIFPSQLKGTVRVPPSKSLAHRALICAALASGESQIYPISTSQDMEATIDCLRMLGAQIERVGESVTVRGIGENPIETSSGPLVFECRESGSTLRFLIPIVLAVAARQEEKETFLFTGKGKLPKRPLTVYLDMFREQGIQYHCEEDPLPLHVTGQLRSGHFQVPGNISSQFVSGLLFALPLLKGDSTMTITGPLESKGYIDLTLAVLAEFGIQIRHEGYRVFHISGGQCYQSKPYEVEGDYSQAAFFMVANALGHTIQLEGLREDSLQGDKAILEMLVRMGCSHHQVCNGRNLINGPFSLTSAIIEGDQCPDVIPVLSLAGAMAVGTTDIIKAERLRWKECDRLQATYETLREFGVPVEETGDGLRIQGISQLRGGATFWSHNDHRIAMMIAIGATRCDSPIQLTDWECVRKSYPTFFQEYEALGGKINE